MKKTKDYEVIAKLTELEIKRFKDNAYLAAAAKQILKECEMTRDALWDELAKKYTFERGSPVVLNIDNWEIRKTK